MSWSESVKFIHWKNESDSLSKSSGPFIIMAASGMESGGKIIEHLKVHVENANNLILLTGYQAGETPGGAILEGETHLKISDKKIDIQAQVQQLASLSANADQIQLIHWLESMNKRPKRVFISHGEEASKKKLATALSNKNYETVVRAIDQSFDIE